MKKIVVKGHLTGSEWTQITVRVDSPRDLPILSTRGNALSFAKLLLLFEVDKPVKITVEQK